MNEFKYLDFFITHHGFEDLEPEELLTELEDHGEYVLAAFVDGMIAWESALNEGRV